MNELQILEAKFTEFGVNNDEDYAKASDYLKEIKTFIKSLEAKKKELVKPFKDSIKNLEAEFKLPISKAETIKLEVESCINSYLVEKEKEERKKAEEKRALELQMLELDREFMEQVPASNEFALNAIDKQISTLENKEVEVKIGIKGNHSSLVVRKVLDYEIIDESLVPRFYLSVDDRKVKQALKDGVTEIPGIRIFQRNIQVSR